jgi:hypothetical protein
VIDKKRFKTTPERATIIAAVIGLLGVVTVALIELLGSNSREPASIVPPNPILSTVQPNPTLSTGAQLSEVELVDVSATERGSETVLIDIKVRNTGSKTSILKRAIAHVKNWRIIGTCTIGGPMPVSSRYKLTLPLDAPGPNFDVPIDLSDSLEPNEAARIQIEAGLDEERPFIDGMILQIQLELQFDSRGLAMAEPILISLPGELSSKKTWRDMRSEVDDFGSKCAEENLADLEFMLNLAGRRSRDLDQLTTE